jgi:ribonuclease VapC
VVNDISYVLDASAVLAFLFDEPGADPVTEALQHKCALSAVNWAEVLSKLADLGEDPKTVVAQLHKQALLPGALHIFPLTDRLAEEIARLRPLTQKLGLSLGDRACLALGRSLKKTILTADRIWLKLDIGLSIKGIR